MTGVGQAWRGAPGAAAVVAALLLAGCGDESASPVQALPQSLAMMEEATLTGRLSSNGAPPRLSQFRIVRSPVFGQLSHDPRSGEFVYVPNKDYFGVDRFSFVAGDPSRPSQPAEVTIAVHNVNDAPVLAAVPDLHNSAETLEVRHVLGVTDVDGETPSLSISVVDPSVADVRLDADQRTLIFVPRREGITDVTVQAADAVTASSDAFKFIVTEVRKELAVDVDDASLGAIRLSNSSERTVGFLLEHNGFPTFRDINAIVRFVMDSPAEYPGEGFERKLWRFVREQVLHDVPLSAREWLYDPWVTVSSLGWGFCGHVSGSYVEIARAAGLEARVWGLDGHVVPEVLVGQRWVMFDPDLAVYYRDRDGAIVGVEDLVADLTLMTDPAEPIFDRSVYDVPYSERIANIYRSTENNRVTETFTAQAPTPAGRVVLPPGASLTYPGRWTEAPVGVDGEVEFTVRNYRQALLELPAGWSGTLTLPWMLWDTAGSGTVDIDGVAFAAGSPELRERIRQTDAAITELTLSGSGPVSVVFFINAVRYDIRRRNEIVLEGVDVWAIEARGIELDPALAAGAAVAAAYRKPLPVTF
jgi:hypothetical protein